MQALIDVILPVFLVLGAGYLARWRGWASDEMVDQLMRFSQNFGIPALLFVSISRLDLAEVFDPRLLASFYAGAISGFALGLLGARFLFGRPWDHAVAVGFVCLFSNSVLLGLPIAERAYGVDSLSANFAIIAIHSPTCYIIGITAMEAVRAQGAGALVALGRVLRGLASNALVIGIVLGIAVNLTGLNPPDTVYDAIAMIGRAGLPTALFALGGVLFLYRPAGDLRLIFYACAVSLLAHPAIAWAVGSGLGLSQAQMRASVVTAAMAPGVNAYLFANMYGVARRVAASAVLIATVLSALTIWIWMAILG